MALTDYAPCLAFKDAWATAIQSICRSDSTVQQTQSMCQTFPKELTESVELSVRGPRALHAHTRARFDTFQGKSVWRGRTHKRHEIWIGGHTNDVPEDQPKVPIKPTAIYLYFTHLQYLAQLPRDVARNESWSSELLR